MPDDAAPAEDPKPSPSSDRIDLGVGTNLFQAICTLCFALAGAFSLPLFLVADFGHSACALPFLGALGGALIGLFVGGLALLIKGAFRDRNKS